MAKSKANNDNVVTITQEVLEKLAGTSRDFKITSAKIKDGYCHYDFEVIEGTGTGDTLNAKGNHVIKDDMRSAFNKLNVHLAFRDDVFKHAGIEIEDIDTMHGHELATLYNVTGFEISGSDESESIVLIGDKYVSGGDRFSLKSPKTMIDNLSSYKWWNELKTAADIARNEVALYREGKYIEEEVEIDEKESAKQTKMSFGEGKRKKKSKADDGASDEDNHGDDDDQDDMSDFKQATV